MSQAYPPAEPAVSEPKKSRGCLFWGCITMLILLVLTIGCLYGGYRMLMGKIDQFIQEYTDDHAQALPKVEMPDEQRQTIVQRGKEFEERYKAVPTADNPGILSDDERTFVLTADELNVLLQKDPKLNGRFYVSLEDDQIKARISMPLSELNWKPVAGRYLNGEGRIVVVLVDGEPHFYLRDVKVKGKPLPDALRDGIEKQEVHPGPQNQPRPRLPRKLEKVEVQDGRLIIVLAKEPNAPAIAPSPPSQPEEPMSEDRSDPEEKEPAQP
jgi:hypothetical protein